MPDNPIPVNFVPPYFPDDLHKYVPKGQRRSLMVDIVGKLGAFPRMEVELEAPDEGFRCYTMSGWQVYYEVHYGSDDEPVEVDVYRVIPEKFSRINVFGP